MLNDCQLNTDMIHIIYSHGRCGSTLFAQLLAACVYTQENTNPTLKGFLHGKYIHHDMNSDVELLRNQRIIHTHQVDSRYNELSKNNIMYFLTRRNIVETLASLMIAQYTKGYNYIPGAKNSKMNKRTFWSKPPTSEKLSLPDSRVQALVESYNYFITKDHYECRRQNANTHLVFYEDWIGDFSKLPFDANYNHDLNYKLTNKIPIDKLEWVDYNILIGQVLKFNNGSTELQV